MAGKGTEPDEEESEFKSLELFPEGGRKPGIMPKKKPKEEVRPEKIVAKKARKEYPEKERVLVLPQPSREGEIEFNPASVPASSSKRYYDVWFYVDRTTPEDWKNFFKKLSDFHTYVTLYITIKGREVHYIIESNRFLENGNAVFHPFRVKQTDAPSIPHAGFPGVRILNHKEVFEFESQENVRKNRAARLIVVRALVKSPLDRNVAWGKVVYSNGQSDALFISDVHKFLSFDMHKMLDKQFEKVKTELRHSDIRFPTQQKSGVFFRKEDIEFGIEDFDFYRHGLLVGQTGSGKSKLLELYLRGLINCGYTKEYSVIFLDPHFNIYNSNKYAGSKQVDFRKEAVELFANVGEPPAATELTQILFSSFLDLDNNPQMSRLLKHSLFLLFSIRKMSFENLNLLLTDTMARKEFLKHCDNPVIKKFFDTEFLEFQTQKYESTILPIVNLINEYSLLSASINEADQHRLVSLINKHNVIFLSPNPSELGRNMVKLIGGALVQQIFMLMQSGMVKKKVILVIDEFSLVQNPAFAQILAEARKFGLTIIMSQQYLGQVDLELLQSMQANVSNLFCFKLNRADAEVVKRMMTLEISAVFESGKQFAEIEEKKIELLTESNPRECIFRVVQDGNYMRPMKAGTVDID